MDWILFKLGQLRLRYTPFPIGFIKPAMAEDEFAALANAFPARELFRSVPKIGKKYALSPRNNARQYADFVASNAVWRDFRDWIESQTFIGEVIAALRERHVDLGVERSPKTGLTRLLKHLKSDMLQGPYPGLRSRFEFSMLPANGGSVIPHTDAPRKLITLVVSMIKPGEWNPEHGGGTEICRPWSDELAFNHVNRQADFADMETVDVFEFTPNQAVLFVKTFNSWHCVRPMSGPADDPPMRKSLTINIERA